MPHTTRLSDVWRLESAAGSQWEHIRAAVLNTLNTHVALEQAIKDKQGNDASVVVFGSLARFEANDASDVDWTYLVDGEADVAHQESSFVLARAIKSLDRKEPGREGTFGSLTFSHDLVHFIGGQDDTNANLTRRILLLLESKPLGDRLVYDRVVRAVLKRYLTSDDGWKAGRSPSRVPRFLQNDIARYWRTVTVDFAYKQWTRENKGWALRSAKLRMSRKLMYAAGLAYAFSLSEQLWGDIPAKTDPVLVQSAIDRLWTLTSDAPLNILARAFLQMKSHEDGKKAFDAYDAFLGILSDKAKRDELEFLEPSAADTSHVYQSVRGIGKEFEAALGSLFFDDATTPFPYLTRIYGVF
jgi:predicted nucleotidyltransferase